MCRAAAFFVASGATDRGVAALDAVLAAFGEHLPSSSGRALAGLLWNRARLRLRGLAWSASHGDARALTRVAVLDGVATAFAMLDPVGGADYQVRALMAALDSGDAK